MVYGWLLSFLLSAVLDMEYERSKNVCMKDVLAKEFKEE